MVRAPVSVIAMRVAGGVLVGWLLVAMLWGAQTSLASTVRGGASMALIPAVRAALSQLAPWVPATMGALAMSIAFPLSRERLLRDLVPHIIATPIFSFSANVLIVLGYWVTSGSFGTIGTLVKEGAVWGTVNFHIALLVYAFILGMTHLAMFARRTQAAALQLAEMELLVSRARLQALTAQIRPHFLFNTLHTIGQLWRGGRYDDAEAAIDHLGELFHKVQAYTSQLEVTVQEELDVVREYLYIEGVRFRDRLTYVVTADACAEELYVPPLILQPLVENAVRHGISAISTAGRVAVRAVCFENRLRLTVEDDGPGPHAGTQTPGLGTGLRNTTERIQKMYGGDASMHVERGERGGTIVTVMLPMSRERIMGRSVGGHE